VTSTTNTMSDLAKRIVVWPGQSVPRMHALFGVRDPEVRSGAVISATLSGFELLEPPDPELFLAVAHLNLDDDAAIAEFIGFKGLMQGGFREIEGAERAHEDVFADLRAVRRRLRRHYFELVGPKDGRAFIRELEGQSLVEFRFAAGCFRDLLRAWRWIAEGLQPESWESLVWMHRPDLVPGDPLAAAALLSAELTAGIDIFAPRVELVLDTEFSGDSWRSRIGELTGAATPLWHQFAAPATQSGRQATATSNRLAAYGSRSQSHFISGYSLCCIQLFNAIVEEARISVCANPRCKALFIRGHRRDGTPRARRGDYCGDHCADAVRKRRQRSRRGLS
jgi:hypothetical protein